MFTDDSLERVAQITSEVLSDKCSDLHRGDISGEDDFSSALLSSLRDRLNGLMLSLETAHRLNLGPAPQSVYSVHARALTTRHARSEENLSGADMLLGFRGKVEDVALAKSALVQAKLFPGDGEFRGFPRTAKDKRYLRQQCVRMTAIAGDAAYVVIYSQAGVRFYSARRYLQTYPNGLDFNQGHDFSDFVKGLFSCDVGNPGIDYMAKGEFRPYLDGVGIRHGFDVEVREQE